MVSIYGKYRCRMCGEVFELIFNTEPLSTHMETLNVWIRENGFPPDDFARHYCADEQIGIADFLGVALASTLTTENGGDHGL